MRDGDLDLAIARLYVRRSRHLWQDNRPKTRSARRSVELFPETVRLLAGLRPLQVMPETPVFTNMNGQPIEPNSFLVPWYRCLRALGGSVGSTAPRIRWECPGSC